MTRLAYVVTSSLTADKLLRGQLRFLRERGYEVLLIAGGEKRALEAVGEREGVGVLHVPMEREISPLRDLLSLARLSAALWRFSPELLNVSTPKAGLLAGIAGALCRVPNRVYVLRGLRLETTTGLKRALLATTERVAARCAHTVVAVSHSLRERHRELGLAGKAPVIVLGSGSSNGVDCARFSESGDGVRAQLGFSADSFVVGFVGRLTADKGVEDLLEAFGSLRDTNSKARLLVLGDFEDGDPVSDASRHTVALSGDIVHCGAVGDVAPYYRAMDVLAFPSAREGFPNVPLEAAACGLPTVGYRVTGTVDAVVHRSTGTLVEAGERSGLLQALKAYADDQVLRKRHGQAARQRAEEHFAPRAVWRELDSLYGKLMARRPTKSSNGQDGKSRRRSRR